MHYILYARLEHFYVQTLSKADPSLAELPLIVHHKKEILDLNTLAEECGAKEGMALSEAKTLVHGGTFISWEEDTFEAAQEEWLEICTNFSDIIEPEHQHSAYMDLKGHADPLSLVDKFKDDLLQRLNWTCQTGIAGSKWLAKVAEIHRTNSSSLSAVSTKYLLPISEEHRKRLRFLGYRTFGEIAEIPLAVLQEQFGQEGILIYLAVRGGIQQNVEASFPKGVASTRVRFDSAVNNLEEIQIAYNKLSKDLATALQAKDSQGTELIVTIETEDGFCKRLQRKFLKPMHSSREIGSGLRLLLNTQLRDPVAEIRVRMPNLTKTERFQRELSGAHSAQERAASTTAAFTHIRTVFGNSAIEVASQKKEPRRKVLMRVWKNATGWS